MARRKNKLPADLLERAQRLARPPYRSLQQTLERAWQLGGQTLRRQPDLAADYAPYGAPVGCPAPLPYGYHVAPESRDRTLFAGLVVLAELDRRAAEQPAEAGAQLTTTHRTRRWILPARERALRCTWRSTNEHVNNSPALTTGHVHPDQTPPRAGPDARGATNAVRPYTRHPGAATTGSRGRGPGLLPARCAGA
jgi:hypothetical protein